MGTTGRAATPRPVTPLGILAAELERLCGELAGLDAVGTELKDGLRRASELASGLDPYLDRCTTPESPALRALAERTHAEDWDRRNVEAPGGRLEQEMLSGHVEGQVLSFLVHLSRATRVLDIGMFTGYSALAMAEALPDGGEVVACEVDPYVAAVAAECFTRSPSGTKISIRVGPALATLRQLADAGERFDLAFIDADKATYGDYLDLLLDTGLLAPGAVICADNTLLQGQPYASSGETTANGAAIATFNTKVADDPRVAQVLVPIRDGLTLIRRV